MIRFSEVIADGIDSPINLFLAEGDSAAVITSREIENDAIIKVILGFKAPAGGDFSLGGEQPAALTDSEICLYRRKIGVIYQDGGFISNLNLWENLTLQIAFDGILSRKEIEKAGISALEKVGYTGSPTLLVSRLSLFQRRQIAFARSFLLNPSVMIYHSTFDGLTRAEQRQLAPLVWNNHVTGGKTSLFLTTYPDSLKGMDFDHTYSTGGTHQL